MESYVDDSKLCLSFLVKDAEDASARLTVDLWRITAWCCSYCLLINPNRNKVLLLGTRQMLNKVPDSYHVILLGKETAPVLSARVLGVILDTFLTYDEHITSVVSKCISSLCQINRVRHILDKSDNGYKCLNFQ